MQCTWVIFLTFPTEIYDLLWVFSSQILLSLFVLIFYQGAYAKHKGMVSSLFLFPNLAQETSLVHGTLHFLPPHWTTKNLDLTFKFLICINI